MPPKTIPFSSTAAIPRTIPFNAAQQTKPDLPNSIWDEITGAFTGGINQAVTALNTKPTGIFNSFENAAKAGAGIVGAVTAPLAPIINRTVGKAVSAIGGVVSDIPAVQNFANSKAGDYTNRIAEDLGNLSTIALGVEGGISTVKAIPRIVEKTSSIFPKAPIDELGLTPKAREILTAREEELFNIQNNYAKTRKAMDYSKDAGYSSRLRVAASDALVNSVDENGVIRTKQPGGAVDKYKAETLDGAEQVVRNDLVREGSSVYPNVVRAKLRENILHSGLEGKALTTALNAIDGEMEGLMLRADANGKIPTYILQDAKISTTNGINYATEPHVKTGAKAVASAYKKLIEDNSNLNITEVNKVLGNYLDDVSLLESLDGLRVRGGKLGKYFAQISGNIVGGVAGSAVGGPVGAALGTVVGGELASKIKGILMNETFGSQAGVPMPKNQILQDAIQRSQSPRPALPAPRDEFRSQINSSATIPLGPKIIDEAQSNNFGNRSQTYNATPTTKTNIIGDNTTTELPQKQYTDGSAKTLTAFEESKNQKSVGEFDLGSFGLNSAKNKSGNPDRFPASELADTQKHLVAAYRASDNPKSYRSDNIAWVSEMPNGEKRVIYTRLNKDGKEEILNWHIISNPEFLETLKSFSTPAEIRTRILSLERSGSNPLTYGDETSVA